MTNRNIISQSQKLFIQWFFTFWLCITLWPSQLVAANADPDGTLWRNLLLTNESRHIVEANRNFYIGQELADPATEMRKLLSNSIEEMSCRFPARVLYLERTGRLLKSPDFSSCEQLQKFMSVMASDSLELIFAGPSVNSPMSYFGHIFLKFKKKDDKYFSRTLAFVAPLEESDSMFAITAEGAFSSIPGQYHIAPYHQIVSQYIELEQRPIYSYKLEIEPENKRLLLYHIFELAALDRPYNFFWGNCATRIQELFAIAFPSKLGREDGGIVSPQSVIESLRDRDLISQEEKTPARSEVLFSAYHALAAHQQTALKALLATSNKETWIQKNGKTTVSLAQAIYRRQFLALDQPPPDYSVLMDINAEPLPNPNAKPNQITPARMIAFGLENHDEPMATLRFRPGLFGRTLESLALATESSFRYLDTTVSVTDTTTSLEQLDLIALSAVKKRSVVGRPLSWTFDTGFNREFDDSSLNYHLGAGVGMAWGEQNYLVSVIPRLEYFAGEGVFPSLNVNASLRLGRSRVDAEIRHFDPSESNRPKNRRYLAVNYYFSPNWVFRGGVDEATKGFDIAISHNF